MIELLRAIRSRPIVAGILVTAITLVVAGWAVFAVTSAGCNVFRGARCTQATNTAALTSPSPSTSSRSPIPSPQITQLPTQQPTTAPASSFPPYVPPASGSVPTGAGSASGVPMYPAASAGGPSAYSQIHCSLPVYAAGPGSGGFITFPDGAFIADPKSNVTQSPPPGAASPAPPGPGYGGNFFSLSYDRAYRKWLPVPVRWVSPDGGHYAFPWGSGDIYGVDVATGAVTELGSGHVWNLLDVTNDGAYLAISDVGGLWFLPFSGTPRQIASNGYWQGVAAGAAYGTITSAVPNGASNTILHLDIATGKTVQWFTQPGSQSQVTGFDAAGHPVINGSAYDGAAGTWIATGPGTAIALSAGLYYQSGLNGTPVADANGIWFNGYGYAAANIMLYTNHALYGMSKIGATVAGGCS